MSVPASIDGFLQRGALAGVELEHYRDLSAHVVGHWTDGVWSLIITPSSWTEVIAHLPWFDASAMLITLPGHAERLDGAPAGRSLTMLCLNRAAGSWSTRTWWWAPDGERTQVDDALLADPSVAAIVRRRLGLDNVN